MFPDLNLRYKYIKNMSEAFYLRIMLELVNEMANISMNCSRSPDIINLELRKLLLRKIETMETLNNAFIQQLNKSKNRLESQVNYINSISDSTE
jgi:hypothetical protein